MDPDGELLRRSLAGDAEAFTALYRRRQGAIYRFALHMSGSGSMADDVTQEVFLALLREGRAWEESRGSLAAYLFGIARKQVLRALGKGRGHVPLGGGEDELGEESMPAAGDDPLGELTRRESIEAVRRAILRLPAQYREAVVLCDLEEMSYADAAEALGCAVGTVRSRLSRARKMLTERLAPGRETQMRGGAGYEIA